MLPFGRDPGDGEAAECFAGGVIGPALEVLFGHLLVVGDEAGEIHRVIDARVVEIERELIILLDPLLDFLEVLNAYAENGLLDAVIQKDALVVFLGEGLELGDDFGGGCHKCKLRGGSLAVMGSQTGAWEPNRPGPSLVPANWILRL